LCRNPVFTLAKIPTRVLTGLKPSPSKSVAIQYLPWLRFPPVFFLSNRLFIKNCRNPVFTLAKIPTVLQTALLLNAVNIVAIQYLPWLRFPRCYFFESQLFECECRNPVFTLAKIPTELAQSLNELEKAVAIQYLPWLRFPHNSNFDYADFHECNCRNPVFTLAKIPTRQITARGLASSLMSQSSIYPG